MRVAVGMGGRGLQLVQTHTIAQAAAHAHAHARTHLNLTYFLAPLNLAPVLLGITPSKRAGVCCSTGLAEVVALRDTAVCKENMLRLVLLVNGWKKAGAVWVWACTKVRVQQSQPRAVVYNLQMTVYKSMY